MERAQRAFPREAPNGAWRCKDPHQSQKLGDGLGEVGVGVGRAGGIGLGGIGVEVGGGS